VPPDVVSVHRRPRRNGELRQSADVWSSIIVRSAVISHTATDLVPSANHALHPDALPEAGRTLMSR